jgi:hypothetical protein
LSDSPLCSGAVDFQIRTRRGILKLSRRDTRRSWLDIFIVVSTHQGVGRRSLEMKRGTKVYQMIFWN